MTNGKNNHTITLEEIAHKVMVLRGFIPDFPTSVLEQLDTIHEANDSSKPQKDLRNLLWISIDNDDSLDLDQLTFAQKTPSGKDKIYIAIADVDSLVKVGSAIDAYAAKNTTSVYTPTKVFPMLPSKLSTNLTSLNEHVDRCAIVVEVDIAPNGQFDLCDIYSASVRNQGKLTYNGVAAWLDQKGPLPKEIPGLAEQLKLQDDIAVRIEHYRHSQGALSFASKEIQPIIENGVPVGLKEKVSNRADSLIENFMIAANVAATKYLMKKKMPTLRRVVQTPKRWDRIIALAKDLGEHLPAEPDPKALRDFLSHREKADPERFPDLSLAMIKLIGRGEYVLGLPGEPSPGHFDLALRDYAHTTAPNRRFPDLIMQRLLKCCLQGLKIPYRNEELFSIATHCTEKEDDASRVERRVHKSAAAMVLQPQLGHEFPAMISGINEDGTWVRILNVPVEGKLTEGYNGLDIGDHLTVKLVHVDIPYGHIDFVRI